MADFKQCLRLPCARLREKKEVLGWESPASKGWEVLGRVGRRGKDEGCPGGWTGLSKGVELGLKLK